MEELSLRMRFKRSIRVIVIFATAIIFAYDIIYFVGSRYNIGMFSFNICRMLSPHMSGVFLLDIFIRLFTKVKSTY